MGIVSINPANGEPIESFPSLSSIELDEKLAKAWNAFQKYRLTSIAERAEMMRRAAGILGNEKESFGRIMTAEMGKTLRAAVAESAKCAWVCRYFAESAECWLADEPVDTGAGKSFVHYEPLGPVLAIMPWNFPFWQVFRFAAPHSWRAMPDSSNTRPMFRNAHWRSRPYFAVPDFRRASFKRC